VIPSSPTTANKPNPAEGHPDAEFAAAADVIVEAGSKQQQAWREAATHAAALDQLVDPWLPLQC
jgi:hypothetical protein